MIQLPLPASACIIAFLLIIWYNAKHTPPPPQQQPAPVISSTSTDGNGVAPEQIPQETKNLPLLSGVQPATPAGVSTTYNPLQAAPLPQQEPLLLEIPGTLEASLDPAGGGITSVRLEKHLLHKGMTKGQRPKGCPRAL